MLRNIVYLVLIFFVCFSVNAKIAQSAQYNLDSTGCVDYEDLKILAGFWLEDCNQANNWCNNADFDLSSTVDFADYSALAANWQKIPGLLGWWQFDEETGDISADMSGNGNDANLVGGPVKVAWDYGNGLNLNGTDQYAVIGNESFFDVADNNITISCWIKKNGNTQTGALISKYDCFKLYIDEVSTAVTFYCEGAGMPAFGTTNVCDDKWHHVVGVHDGATKKLYIDGVLDKSSNSMGSIINNDYKVVIGSDDKLAGQKLQGVIDEVQIYNKALSADTVRAMADKYFAAAHYTSPVDNATFQLTDVTLMWKPGRYAVTHDIYFGTDFEAVDNATHDSNEYMGNFAIDVNSFSPAGLEYETTYFWRIDEVNDFD